MKIKYLTLTSLFLSHTSLTSCGGEKGETGLTGPKGPAGENGKDGKDGKDGATGPTGAPGENGTDNRVTSTLYCTGTTSGANPSGVKVDYWATVTAAGDVWASAEVSDNGVDGTSSSRFYSAKQVGAQTAAVSVVADWLTPFNNGGWWFVEVNRTSGVATATYHDVGVKQVFTFLSSSCSIKNY
jgi:hypothetical protein